MDGNESGEAVFIRVFSFFSFFFFFRMKIFKYFFLTISFFFFLRLNSDRQFVESYWEGEVNEINVEMDFVNFI